MADVAANTSTTANFAVGANSMQYSGRFETAGDVDWIRLSLTAGTVYRFYGSAQTDANPDAGDILMYLRRPDGTHILSDGEDGVGLNAYFEYVPMTSGTYYLAVAEYEEVPGTYDVTVLSFSGAQSAASPDQFLTSGGDSAVSSGSDAVRIAGQGNDYQNNFFRILGEQGNDSLWGDDRVNVISGGLGDDVVFGRGGSDEIWGGAGDDLLNGDGGNDQIYADAGDDEVNGGEGNDYLAGHLGEDTLRGGNGYDLLTGGADDDRLDGGALDDQLYGDDGDDFLIPGAGSDDVEGGPGVDLIYYGDNSGPVHVNLVQGVTTDTNGKIDQLTGIEAVWGSPFADRIRGDAAINRLLGQNGNDVLEGFGGGDELVGAAGDDVLRGGGGADRLDGGAGVDAVSYTDSAAAVQVDLNLGTGAGGDAAGDLLTSIEIVHGTTLADKLSGTSGGETLRGFGGDDVLRGRGGADLLEGGSGVDAVSYTDSVSAVQVDLQSGLGAGGDAAGDVLTSIEIVHGSNFADKLSGGAEAEILRGFNGDDVLRGRGGADLLEGGNGVDVATYTDSAGGVEIDLSTGTGAGGDAAGDRLISIETVHGSNFVDVLIGSDRAETLRGFGGNDRLSGGRGADLLEGGGGADTFLYSSATESSGAGGHDIIGDFNRLQGDRIDLSQIDADPGQIGLQAFRFLGNQAFDGAAGALTVEVQDASTSLVLIDINGDLVAEMAILVRGMGSGLAEDFAL
ncbi:calcium-binding protein [Tistrella mobilis]